MTAAPRRILTVNATFKQIEMTILIERVSRLPQNWAFKTLEPEAMPKIRRLKIKKGWLASDEAESSVWPIFPSISESIICAARVIRFCATIGSISVTSVL